MSGVGVEFVGGPIDGRHQWIHCADPMDPPLTWLCEEVNVAAWSRGLSLDAPVPVRTHVYLREPSGRDEGPLWLYRWAGEQP